MKIVHIYVTLIASPSQIKTRGIPQVQIKESIRLTFKFQKKIVGKP